MSDFDQIMAELKAIKEMLANRCCGCRCYPYYYGTTWQVDLNPKTPINTYTTAPNTTTAQGITYCQNLSGGFSTCGSGCKHDAP